MQKPTIHLNGTSAGALLEQYRNASQALHKALEAMFEAAPHARDYYAQGEDAFYKAADEHAERVARLRAVKQEMDELAEHAAEHVK